MSGGRQSLSGTTALGTGTRKLDNALRKLSVANAFNKKAPCGNAPPPSASDHGLTDDDGDAGSILFDSVPFAPPVPHGPFWGLYGRREEVVELLEHGTVADCSSRHLLAQACSEQVVFVAHLGLGACCTVDLVAVHLPDGSRLLAAAKCCYLPASDARLKAALREAEVLQRCEGCPFVVPLLHLYSETVAPSGTDGMGAGGGALLLGSGELAPASSMSRRNSIGGIGSMQWGSPDAGGLGMGGTDAQAQRHSGAEAPWQQWAANGSPSAMAAAHGANGSGAGGAINLSRRASMGSSPWQPCSPSPSGGPAHGHGWAAPDSPRARLMSSNNAAASLPGSPRYGLNDGGSSYSQLGLGWSTPGFEATEMYNSIMVGEDGACGGGAGAGAADGGGVLCTLLIGWARGSDMRKLVQLMLARSPAHLQVSREAGGLPAPAGLPLLMPEAAARFYMACLVLALERLHHELAPGVVHRDLKLANLLLGHDGYLLVGDLGCAADLASAPGGRLHARVGSPGHMAPEVALREARGYDTSADVWSAGACLYNMLLGQLPAGIAGPPGRSWKPVLSRAMSPELADLLARMLSTEPGERPAARALRADPWFQGFPWRALAAQRLPAPADVPWRELLWRPKDRQRHYGQGTRH